MDRWSPRGSGVSCGKSRRLLVGGGTAPAHRSSQSRGGQRPVELERAQVVLRAWHTVPPPASVPATVPVLHSSTMPTLRQLVGGLQHPAALPRAWCPLQGLHFVPGPAHAQHDKWRRACSTQSPCPMPAPAPESHSPTMSVSRQPPALDTLALPTPVPVPTRVPVPNSRQLVRSLQHLHEEGVDGGVSDELEEEEVFQALEADGA